MPTILKLENPLTQKEQEMFKIPNQLSIDNFDGYQYAMCLCGIQKGIDGKYRYNPVYSKNYIDTDITPNKIMSFAELHKDMVIKEKNFCDGRFSTVYYIVYKRDYAPGLLNDFYLHEKNRSVIEVIFGNGAYYRPYILRLELSPYTPIIAAVESLFSNENLEVLKCITKIPNGNKYQMDYYDELGHMKVFVHPNMKDIYNHIISIRLLENTMV